MEQSEEIDQLKFFNLKVAKLERGAFAKRFAEKELEVIMKFEGPVEFTQTGDSDFVLSGKIKSWVPEFEEEEIDAFALSYRILTQKNDRLSIANIAEIYERDWMHSDARDEFRNGRKYLNDYLDSAATIEFGPNQVSIRQIVDVVMYGSLAHSDKKKEEIFESWASNPAMSGLIWVEFMAAMNKALFVCSFFKRLNEAVIEAYEAAREAKSLSS